MNTASKLQSRLISAADQWDEYAAASLTSSNATLWRNSAQLLRDAAEALAPPSGEGVGLTVADAWFESPTEITIHAKASCGAKLPEEGTKIYTAPQSAPVDGGVGAGSGKLISDVMSHHAPKIVHKRGDSFPEYTYTREQVLSMLWDLQGNLTSPPPASQERGGDREVLLYLMQQFDCETWECEKCGHSEDCKTMDSAEYLRSYLAASPPSSAAESNGDPCIECGADPGEPCAPTCCTGLVNSGPDAAEQAKPDGDDK